MAFTHCGNSACIKMWVGKNIALPGNAGDFFQNHGLLKGEQCFLYQLVMLIHLG